MPKAKSDLVIKSISCVITYLFIGILLFLSAGTIHFVEAWMFMITLLVSAIGLLAWLYLFHPNQLRNRLGDGETEKAQKVVVRAIGLIILLSLIVAGIDKRIGLTNPSGWRLPIAAGTLVSSALILINVFSVNPFLSNSVKIHEGQYVISHGMYKVVRHPMYLAVCLAYAAGLLILGSVPNLILYVAFLYLIDTRAKYEEKQLISNVPGYTEYMKKVTHRVFC